MGLWSILIKTLLPVIIQKIKGPWRYSRKTSVEVLICLPRDNSVKHQYTESNPVQSNPIPYHQNQMAAAFAPVTPLRLRPYSTLRFLSFYPKTLSKPRHVFPPLLRRSQIPRRRFFSSVISGALHSGERTKSELAEKQKGEMGSKVGEYRKKLKIADIKGGPDEGLDWVGQTLVVMGWVRTLRAQSSVTFVEVTIVSVL